MQFLNKTEQTTDVLIFGETFRLDIQDANLLMQSNYISQNANGKFEANTGIRFDVSEKLKDLKESEILQIHSERLIKRIVKKLEKLLPGYELLMTVSNLDFGIQIFCSLRIVVRKQNFRVGKDLIKSFQNPFVVVFLNWKHRTISIQGEINANCRKYECKNFYDELYKFLEYDSAYSVNDLFLNVKPNFELLKSFTEV